jgi:hypothetical protein
MCCTCKQRRTTNFRSSREAVCKKETCFSQRSDEMPGNVFLHVYSSNETPVLAWGCRYIKHWDKEAGDLWTTKLTTAPKYSETLLKCNPETTEACLQRKILASPDDPNYKYLYSTKTSFNGNKFWSLAVPLQGRFQIRTTSTRIQRKLPLTEINFGPLRFPYKAGFRSELQVPVFKGNFLQRK